MIPVANSLPFKAGAADPFVERFAESRGYGFPGFGSMEVMRSEEGDEVLVIMHCQIRASFDAWVGSEEFVPTSAPPIPRLRDTSLQQKGGSL